MFVEIDPNSGFCFGVVNAIEMAEAELDMYGKLYCLGEIVHNNTEVARLEKKGLQTISHKDLKSLHNTRVLIRAHGEPPETYRIARENNIELIDASCPVVLKLQNRISKGFTEMQECGGQIVILGKADHAEVNGLLGQTNGKAIIISSLEDLSKVDFSRPIVLFSQTTQSHQLFTNISTEIKKRFIENGLSADDYFVANDSICRQVLNRESRLREFAKANEVVIFVSGKQSSNGKVLYKVCRDTNQQTYMVSDTDEIQSEWFEKINTVGICGATSTPRWLMEKVAAYIREKYNKT
jgi:4-hydroxy-3-methylbut-2-en-1-yl diphosphate reductase